MPFKDRFKGPFKGRNRAASAEQLEVMQSYNSQETTIFFCEKPKFVASRRPERKHLAVCLQFGWRSPPDTLPIGKKLGWAGEVKYDYSAAYN